MWMFNHCYYAFDRNMTGGPIGFYTSGTLTYTYHRNMLGLNSKKSFIQNCPCFVSPVHPPSLSLRPLTASLFIYQHCISPKATVAVFSPLSFPSSFAFVLCGYYLCFHLFCNLFLLCLSLPSSLFFLPQTQGVRTHSCACAQLRTNTLEHICLVMLASANLSVGEIKV